MRIRFICPRIFPGSCGVGDYTRRLAGALALRGVQTEIVATHDSEVDSTQEYELWEGGATIPCLRIAPRDSAARKKALRHRIPEAGEIWSLQFSGFYAYHSKGLPHVFRQQIASYLEGKPLHVMCHEIGLDPKASIPWKKRILGTLQRRELLRFLRRASPSLVQTHTPYYRSWLRNSGVEASLLPLFGNIPVSNSAEEGWAFCNLMYEGALKDILLLGVFGTVHPDWNPRALLDLALMVSESCGMRTVLAFIGRTGSHLHACVARLQEAYGSRLSIIILGEQPPERLSDFLRKLRFGLSTNGWGLNAKSGTVAAMLDHSVPVVVTHDTLYAFHGEVRGGLVRFSEESFCRDLEHARVALAKQSSCLDVVADQFLRELVQITDDKLAGALVSKRGV